MLTHRVEVARRLNGVWNVARSETEGWAGC